MRQVCAADMAGGKTAYRGHAIYSQRVSQRLRTR